MSGPTGEFGTSPVESRGRSVQTKRERLEDHLCLIWSARLQDDLTLARRRLRLMPRRMRPRLREMFAAVLAAVEAIPQHRNTDMSDEWEYMIYAHQLEHLMTTSAAGSMRDFLESLSALYRSRLGREVKTLINAIDETSGGRRASEDHSQ